MSAAQIGKTLSEEHRANIGAAQIGKTLSEEHRAKVSAAKFGKTLSEEHRAKMSAANLGKTLSEEHRAKISLAIRKANATRKRLKEQDALIAAGLLDTDGLDFVAPISASNVVSLAEYRAARAKAA